MQQYGQARLAVVDENKGDGYQYDQLGVHHDVFDLAHALDAPYIDKGKDQDNDSRNELAYNSAVGECKSAYGVGREGIGIQRQCADIAEYHPPAYQRCGKV